MQRYDVAIIGSGPAGIEAAINLKIRNKDFILFGDKDLSRKISVAPKIDNYLGLPDISGKDLQQHFLDHMKRMDITPVPEQIQMIYPMGDYFSLASSKNLYEARTVILATGAFSANPLTGEDEFLGRGVGYCATCDAPLYKGKTVAILGYNDESVHEADFIATLAAKTYFIPMKKITSTPSDEVEIIKENPVAIVGDKKVNSLKFKDHELSVDGVFILRDTLAPSSLIPGLQQENGFIKVDQHMATNISGCFAAGDCTGKPHQYMRAAGQGQVAALNVVDFME